MASISNGFRFTTPDGARWEDVSGEFSDALNWDSVFNLVTSISHFIGGPFDTVTFGGASFGQTGLLPGADIIGYLISTDSIYCDDIGKTICIDSSWAPPCHAWLWSGPGVNILPSWPGPYCFTIAPCCHGIRGNVDGDPYDMITITDLTYIVQYAFFSGPRAPCVEEGDVDGSGSLTPFIVDIVYLVEYMFRGGPPPPPCP
jgi:hypothetical protein